MHFYLFVYFYFFFWPHRVACGILVPQPGIEPMPPAVEGQGPNHWTAREVPQAFIFAAYLLKTFEAYIHFLFKCRCTYKMSIFNAQIQHLPIFWLKFQGSDNVWSGSLKFEYSLWKIRCIWFMEKWNQNAYGLWKNETKTILTKWNQNVSRYLEPIKSQTTKMRSGSLLKFTLSFVDWMMPHLI